MSLTLTGDKVRWAIAGGVAIGATLLLVMLFRFPPGGVVLPSAGTTEIPSARVQLAKSAVADAFLKEETEIRDLRPLFLPTEFNATLPDPRREPGRTFLDSELPKFGFAEADLTIGRDLPAVATINGKSAELAKPVDIVTADADGGPLLGFGRQPTQVAAIVARGGFVEVFASASGHRVLAETLPVEARRTVDAAWEPLELLAAVGPAGLTAPLVVTTSSRNEEIDLHYRNFLAQTYRIGERLPPGFYRIVVAP